jgi:hypothetical protein
MRAAEELADRFRDRAWRLRPQPLLLVLWHNGSSRPFGSVACVNRANACDNGGPQRCINVARGRAHTGGSSLMLIRYTSVAERSPGAQRA